MKEIAKTAGYEPLEIKVKNVKVWIQKKMIQSGKN
jgi:hypothetical protein